MPSAPLTEERRGQGDFLGKAVCLGHRDTQLEAYVTGKLSMNDRASSFRKLSQPVSRKAEHLSQVLGLECALLVLWGATMLGWKACDWSERQDWMI